MRIGLKIVVTLAVLALLVIPALALKKGDANRDGTITSADAEAALRMAVGLVPADPIADVNGDGQVTAADALKILRVAASIDPADSLPETQRAYFNASTISGSSPLNVTFDAGSAAGFTYLWDFGDGSSATGPLASHIFTRAGTFNVTLTATGSGGQSDVAVRQITVTAGQPMALFTAVPEAGPAPLAVSFNASASSSGDGSLLTYAWKFGDGGTGNGFLSTHTYSTPGSYTATLTVLDGSGRSNSTTRTITVQTATRGQPPVPQFTETWVPDTIANMSLDGSASYDPDGSIASYSWEYTTVVGRVSIGTGSILTYNFVTPGLYNVTLTVVDNQGLSNSTTKSVYAGRPR